MLTCFLSLGLAAPPTVRIVHSGLACNIEEERYSERVYTIREGETLELTCLVTGHPRPQVSPRRRSLPVPEPASPAARCQAGAGLVWAVGWVGCWGAAEETSTAKKGYGFFLV